MSLSAIVRRALAAGLVCAGVALTAPPGRAASAAPTAAVPRAAGAVALDGETGWDGAARLDLGWDFTHGRPAARATSVRVLVDDATLWVRWRAAQREAIVATQRVDGVGDGSDDDVTVRLWPAGENGFEYTFRSTPLGTRYQTSSENATYAPTWRTAAHIGDGGYEVTMAIPLHALRGDGRSVWRAQFERDIRAAGERDEWAHAPGQQTTDQVVHAGTLSGLAAAGRAARTSPRLGVYGLAQAGSAAAGGSTSRMGADLALPLTATTSFVATVHPDFSNVETDQQSIAPTTFRRFLTDVRPFFAQGQSFYDFADCYGCPYLSEYYTPAIPTPRRGYQIEGKQSGFTIGALDAIGNARTDDAQSVAYTTPGKRFTVDYTRVASEQPTLHDLTDFGSIAYNSQHGLLAYLETGAERGTLVTDPSRAIRWDGGVAYQTVNDFVSFTERRIGSQYDPVDGFIQVNDIAGYSAQGSHTFRFAPGSRIQSIGASVYRDHYVGGDGLGTNDTNTSVGINAFFKNRVSFSGGFGSSFYRAPGDPVLHPSNQEGLRLDYLLNTATSSSLSWNGGRFGDGYLTSTDRLAAFRLARRFTVSLDAYDTAWHGDEGGRAVQWLERAAVTADLGPRSSFSLGARTIVGAPPPFAAPIVDGGRQTNLSAAYSIRRPHDELYLVYGDASALRTVPALIVKYVRYLGAEKGT